MNPALVKLRDSGRLRRADAALGDWVARAYADATGDATLAAALTARAVGDGHSALELDRTEAWLASLEGNGAAPSLPPASSWREGLRQSPAVHRDAERTDELRPLVLDGQDRVYLRRYFEYER